MNPLPFNAHTIDIARRTFLRRTGAGLGALALHSLLSPDLFGAGAGKWRGVVNPLHHGAKCKRVIYLY